MLQSLLCRGLWSGDYLLDRGHPWVPNEYNKSVVLDGHPGSIRLHLAILSFPAFPLG